MHLYATIQSRSVSRSYIRLSFAYIYFIHGHATSKGKFKTFFSQFHLFNYLFYFFFFKNHMAPLLEAIRTGDRQKANEWARSEHWATVEQLISATSQSEISSKHTTFENHLSGSSSTGSLSGMSASGTTNNSWTCSHCTFLNRAETGVCDMCSLPR